MKTIFNLRVLFAFALMAFTGAAAYSQCAASFTTSVSGSTATFTNTSTGVPFFGAYSIWDFGDGSVGSSGGTSGIAHTYSSPGVYLVCLLVSDSAGCSSTFCDSVVITTGGGGTCASDFTYTVVGCDVTFADASTSPVGIVSWSWSFGDGTGSSLANPMHTYSGTGPWTVCLTTVAADSCIDTWCVTVSTSSCGGGGGPCMASYSWAHDSTGAYTILLFPTYVGGPASLYLWDFGDGTTSTSAYPSHVYPGVGTYVVCVTISDALCTSTYCDSLDVLWRTNAAFSINVVSTATSVEENTIATDFNVFPNPFSDYLNVSMTLDQNADVSFELLDITGKSVLRQNQGMTSSGKVNVKLNTGNLAPGIYVLKTQTGDQVTYNKVITN